VNQKNIGVVFALASLLVISVFASQSALAQPDKVLIYIKTDSKAKTNHILSQSDVVKRFDLLDGWISIEVPTKVKDRFANTKGVLIEDVNQFEIVAPKWCTPDSTHPACQDDGSSTSSRVVFPSDQTPWGIETIYGDSGITTTSGGAGVRVAVIDTGISSHLDFADKDVTGDGIADKKIAQCLDYTGGKIKNSCSDGNGHGTHVAGTIAANGGVDNKGIYGVSPDATLLVYKVCTNGGMCSGDAIAAAIKRAADDGANIISISLGGSSLSTSEKNAIDYAVSNGVLVIAAAGNSGPNLNTISYPAAYNKVVSVAALEQGTTLRVADFSSRGQDIPFNAESDRLVEVSAPGRSIESTWKDGGYNTISGTSMATPHISGLAAKIWFTILDGNNDGKINDDVRVQMQNSASANDIISGIHARAGYDPAAGLGLARLP
jgi:subtilisin